MPVASVDFVFVENVITSSTATFLRNTGAPSKFGGSTTSARPVDPAGDLEWDRKVAANPNYSCFHSAAWSRVLQDTYGHTPMYLALPAREPDGLLTMLPLMEVDSWVTGRRGVALPFTDECRPLCPDDATGRELIQAALELGTARGWRSVEFRGGEELFGEVPPSQLFYGHWIELDANEDRMLERMNASTRRAIRKAEKNGVRVSISSDLEAMREFYRMHCRTRRKHGLPPQPFAFFRNIQEHVLSSHDGMVSTAHQGGQSLASSIYFQMRTQAVYKFGASYEEHQHLRGSNLVMWEAMKWLARNGAKRLHLGRTSLHNHGLRQFKLGWGAMEFRIAYFKYKFRQGGFVTESDLSVGWHNQLFRALPVSISRMIGASAYRHLA